MLANTFVDNAKVMAKGQIMILKDVRDVLSVSSGDRVIPVLTEKDMSKHTSEMPMIVLFCGQPSKRKADWR